jgi:hypothetical protein
MAAPPQPIAMTSEGPPAPLPIASPPPPAATQEALAAVLGSLEKIQGLLSKESEVDPIRALTVEALHRRLMAESPTLADMMSATQVEAVKAAAPAAQQQEGDGADEKVPAINAATITADEIHAMFTKNMESLIARYTGEMNALAAQRDQALSLIMERERNKQSDLQARFAALIQEASQLALPQ